MNPYKVLGIAKTATEREIKQAYFKLAKELHPDVAKGREAQFIQVSRAYELLSDKSARKDFDSGRRRNDDRPPDWSSSTQQQYQQQQSKYYTSEYEARYAR